MNYPFAFSAVIQDDCDEATREHAYVLDTGMGFADSFSQAAGIVENFYGSDLICINKLELFEDTDLLLLPKEVIDDYRGNKYRGKSCDIDGNIIEESIEQKVNITFKANEVD
jgi:hypothetical protein